MKVEVSAKMLGPRYNHSYVFLVSFKGLFFSISPQAPSHAGLASLLMRRFELNSFVFVFWFVPLVRSSVQPPPLFFSPSKKHKTLPRAYKYDNIIDFEYSDPIL